MKLYYKYISINLRTQMQYRGSFFMTLAGQFIYPFTLLAGIYLLMAQFGEIGGWTIPEVVFCFASLMISYALAEAFARGFDLFSYMVQNGKFDRVLVRPRGTIIQILGSKFELNRVGKVFSSIALYIWALINLELVWGLDKIVVAGGMILAGVVIFSGIFIIAAVWSFWTISGNELLNILTDGTREMARFPLNAYDSKIIRVFIFIIPIASANFLPLLYITGKVSENAWIYALSPFLGMIFIIPCLFLWQFGVRHYKSTGS